MPRRDGTGPAGMGPRTGWGLGTCTPQETETKDAAQNPSAAAPQNFQRPGLGRGLGRGFGRGCGRRGRW